MAPACALTSAQPERKKKVAGRRLSPEESQQEQALGTSRGGLGTKIHVLCEGEGRPITFVLTPGQRHESTQVEALLDRVAIGGKPGAPCRRFDTVAGDRGYDYPHTRRQVAQRGSRPLIPHKKRPDGTYPPEAEGFDKEQYRQRNVVERLLLFAEGDTVTPATVQAALPGQPVGDAGVTFSGIGTLAERVEQVERQMILDEIKRHNQNITNTAKALGLERSHLYKKCQQLGIDLRELRKE
jgi:transposase